MKYIFGLCALLFVGTVGWRLGGRLSSDAIGMALGILFGVMAGIPAALMVLAARRIPYKDEYEQPRRRQPQYQEIPQQPPVIVVTGQNPSESRPYPTLSYYEHKELSGPAPEKRVFRIVGESEEIIDPW